MSEIELLRRIGKAFIWLGALAGGFHFLLTVPGINSVSSFLLLTVDTIGRLSATVGLGAVLLAMAEVIVSLQRSKQANNAGDA